MNEFSIKVYKQYFNFAAAHFMIFPDGTREPLHGHNYRVCLKGRGEKLQGDMVFDFLHIKPIVKELCDRLDHKLLLPKDNVHLRFGENHHNIQVTTPDSSFSFPKEDVMLLPITNTSAEVIAHYLAREIANTVWERHQFRFQSLEVEVEESPGQSAVVNFEAEKSQSVHAP